MVTVEKIVHAMQVLAIMRGRREVNKIAEVGPAPGKNAVLKLIGRNREG
jgi:hypothetical protein